MACWCVSEISLACPDRILSRSSSEEVGKRNNVKKQKRVKKTKEALKSRWNTHRRISSWTINEGHEIVSISIFFASSQPQRHITSRTSRPNPLFFISLWLSDQTPSPVEFIVVPPQGVLCRGPRMQTIFCTENRYRLPPYHDNPCSTHPSVR